MHRILIVPSEFVLQIIHSLLGCNTTPSSCQGLSSPPRPTLASSWPLLGGSHTTYRKAAGSHPGRGTNYGEDLHSLKKKPGGRPGPCADEASHPFPGVLLGFSCLTG